MPEITPKFVFLDLETTGLDPDYDVILEIGMVIVDSDLNLLATFSRVATWDSITYDSKLNLYEPPFGVHKIVTDMHTENGLWEESYRSTKNLETCFENATFWIEQQVQVYTKDKLCLAGNTIGFDRMFLQASNPKFLDLFHHRSIDVSSHRVLYEEWVMNSGENVEPMPVGNDLHRAVPDCLDSIEKLKFFKRKLYDWT
jgi:oligoribonuclease